MSSVRSTAEELSLAEQCDAQGAHDDAINALARATKRGDIEATTRLAKRLIVGDRDEAQRAGHARLDVNASGCEHGEPRGSLGAAVVDRVD